MLEEILKTTSKFRIPSEIVFFEIVPFISKFELTPLILGQTKSKMKLYRMISTEFRIDCKRLKNHLFTNYDGESIFEYETMDTYLYFQFDNVREKINDFLYIIH